MRRLETEAEDNPPAGITTHHIWSEEEVSSIERDINGIKVLADSGKLKSGTVDRTPLRSKFFFGFGYTYGAQISGKGKEELLPPEMVDPIPDWIHKKLIARMEQKGVVEKGWINSAVVNDYQPGGMIVSHIDPKQLFARPIFIATFFADGRLVFGVNFVFAGRKYSPEQSSPPKFTAHMPRGALTVMEGFSADGITHGIRPEDFDSRRVSIVLRHVYDDAPRLSDPQAMLKPAQRGLSVQAIIAKRLDYVPESPRGAKRPMREEAPDDGLEEPAVKGPRLWGRGAQPKASTGLVLPPATGRPRVMSLYAGDQDAEGSVSVGAGLLDGGPLRIAQAFLARSGNAALAQSLVPGQFNSFSGATFPKSTDALVQDMQPPTATATEVKPPMALGGKFGDAGLFVAAALQGGNPTIVGMPGMLGKDGPPPLAGMPGMKTLGNPLTTSSPMKPSGSSNPPADEGHSGGWQQPDSKPSNNSCWHFINLGECVWGDNCRFNHETPRSGPKNDIKPGWSYNHKSVTSKDDFCWHFLNGHCAFGDKCKFTHPAKDGRNDDESDNEWPTCPMVTSEQAESAPVFSSGVERNWYYKDVGGAVQGPFASTTMFAWSRLGLFPPETPLRAEDETEFSEFGSGMRLLTQAMSG